MLKKKKVEVRPKVIINNIVKPMKVKDDEKIILVVGSGDDIPTTDEFDKIAHDLSEIREGVNIVISGAAFKLYIVPDESKIELYRGDKASVK